ncbi:MAG: helix-turn-helix transcriptional regulator [Gemmatimonadota bacterium]
MNDPLSARSQLTIRKAIHAHVRTQHAVAEEVGVSDNTITSWIHARSKPTSANLTRLAEVSESRARELDAVAAELRAAAETA